MQSHSEWCEAVALGAILNGTRQHRERAAPSSAWSSPSPSWGHRGGEAVRVKYSTTSQPGNGYCLPAWCMTQLKLDSVCALWKTGEKLSGKQVHHFIRAINCFLRVGPETALSVVLVPFWVRVLPPSKARSKQESLQIQGGHTGGGLQKGRGKANVFYAEGRFIHDNDRNILVMSELQS